MARDLIDDIGVLVHDVYREQDRRLVPLPRSQGGRARLMLDFGE